MAAVFDAALARRLSNEWLHRAMLGLLLGIGGLLIVEGFLPEEPGPFRDSLTR